MAWTLIVALCIVTYVIVALFSKTFRIFQRKAFVYPSSAEIDQILPPEIIETILYNVDLDTLLACSLVSKYWRYHAEKDYVFKTALDKEKAPRATLAEIAADAKDPNLEIQWLTYHEDHYKPKWHVQDARYINGRGKKLIDATFSSISKILQHRAIFFQKADGFNPTADKYIVRTRLRFSFISSGNAYFYSRDNSGYVCVTLQSIPDRIKDQLRYGIEVEILEDLWRSSTISLANPDSARIVENRNFIGGIPIDKALFGLLYLVFLPCVIKDFGNASSDAKTPITIIFAFAGLLGAFITSIIAVHEGVRSARSNNKKRAELYFNLGLLGIILFSAVFYRQALEIGFFCGAEAGMFMYGLFLYILNENKHPNTKHMIFISFCLIVSVIDWKITVDAARNGAFWYTLLYNMAMHAALWIWTILVNICASSFTRWQLDLKSVDSIVHKIFSFAILGVLFITCAAPYTMHKVQWK